MKTRLPLLVVLAISISIFACSKIGEDLKPQEVSLDLPDQTYDYSRFMSAGVMSISGVNNDVATLGRVLFYDTRLSINNSVACGSCHKQSIAFSDDVTFSPGFENHPTLRNTPPIQNISNTQMNVFGVTTDLFWDGRANFLPAMVLMPIANHVEMGMSDMDAMVEKVKNLNYYDDLFIKAYGSNDVTVVGIADALGAFVSSISSANSRFDLARNNMTQLSALEQQGKNLFFDKYNCNACHKTDQLGGYGTTLTDAFVNIGLDDQYKDIGRQNVTNDIKDNGKFKIPNLRNVTLTAPYMHDGRFSTLEQVLDHYSFSIKNNPALDSRLKDAQGSPMRMNISSGERAAIIAFLGTLTDYSLITDPKFSNPFKSH
jgi:cytochrome c peroxidase